MLTNLEVPFTIQFPGHSQKVELTGIKELGFGGVHGSLLVDAWTTPAVPSGGPRGTLFTTIPISPLEYRRRRPTRTAFKRTARSIRSKLVIYDDHGMPHTLVASKDVIDALERDCIEHEIPEAVIG